MGYTITCRMSIPTLRKAHTVHGLLQVEIGESPHLNCGLNKVSYQYQVVLWEFGVGPEPGLAPRKC